MSNNEIIIARTAYLTAPGYREDRYEDHFERVIYQITKSCYFDLTNKANETLIKNTIAALLDGWSTKIEKYHGRFFIPTRHGQFDYVYNNGLQADYFVTLLKAALVLYQNMLAAFIVSETPEDKVTYINLFLTQVSASIETVHQKSKHRANITGKVTNATIATSLLTIATVIAVSSLAPWILPGAVAFLAVVSTLMLLGTILHALSHVRLGIRASEAYVSHDLKQLKTVGEKIIANENSEVLVVKPSSQEYKVENVAPPAGAYTAPPAYSISG